MEIRHGFFLLLVAVNVHGRTLDSWVSHDISPLQREEMEEHFVEPSDQDVIVYLPSEKEESLEIQSDDGRNLNEETKEEPEEHLVVILDNKEYSREKFEALKHASDPLSVLFPTDSSFDAHIEEHDVPAERLSGFIQDRIPTSVATMVTTKIKNGGRSDANEEASAEALAAESSVEQEIGEVAQEVISSSSSTEEKEIADKVPEGDNAQAEDLKSAVAVSLADIDEASLAAQVLQLIIKDNSRDVQGIARRFPEEFQRLVSALQKDTLPHAISDFAAQYGGGGPLSTLLSGGGIQELIQSLNNFGPTPGVHVFYPPDSASSSSSSSGSSEPGKDGDSEADASAGTSSSHGNQSSSGSANTSSGSNSSRPTASPPSNNGFDSFCVASGRLCQSLIALQPCCSGKPCQPFSQSFLNAFSMGNLGTCL